MQAGDDSSASASTSGSGHIPPTPRSPSPSPTSPGQRHRHPAARAPRLARPAPGHRALRGRDARHERADAARVRPRVSPCTASSTTASTSSSSRSHRPPSPNGCVPIASTAPPFASITRLLHPRTIAVQATTGAPAVDVAADFQGDVTCTDEVEDGTDVVVLDLPPDEIADAGWRWADARAGMFVVMSGGTGDADGRAAGRAQPGAHGPSPRDARARTRRLWHRQHRSGGRAQPPPAAARHVAGSGRRVHGRTHRGAGAARRPAPPAASGSARSSAPATRPTSPPTTCSSTGSRRSATDVILLAVRQFREPGAVRRARPPHLAAEADRDRHPGVTDGRRALPAHRGAARRLPR